jgi:COMPASS component SWD1
LDTGRIYLWSIISPQRWSALAPDFVEVEENVEYMETEEEFDIHPHAEIHQRRLDQEDEEIDALTVDPSKGVVEEDHFRMPVFLDMADSESEEEVVAIGPGEWRLVKSRGDNREINPADGTLSSDERAGKRMTNGTKVSSRSRKR